MLTSILFTIAGTAAWSQLPVVDTAAKEQVAQLSFLTGSGSSVKTHQPITIVISSIITDLLSAYEYGK